MSERPLNKGFQGLRDIRDRLPVAQSTGNPSLPPQSGEAQATLHSVPVGDIGRAGRAPYNFVPLPERIRWLAPSEEPPTADFYHSGRKSGVVDLEIEALTAFYIRGMWPLRDYQGTSSAIRASPSC